jgi:hypothetical protein
MAGEGGDLGEREPRFEGETDEGVAEIVEADLLLAGRVEPRLVSGGVEGAEGVAPRLRLAPSRSKRRAPSDGRSVGRSQPGGSGGLGARARGRAGAGPSPASSPSSRPRGGSRRRLAGGRP